MYKYIEIIETAKGNIVKRIDVSGKSERQADKVEMGVLRNMNLTDFFTKIVESETKLNTF